MGELGNTLSRARRARAITLEDAERDTHVSRRYLQALETEDFSIFPAPVYARGFLRTYSRYLGLNPDELVRVFPNGNLTVDIAPLPTVARPPAHLINVNWVVAGLVALFLVGAGLLLLRTGDSAVVTDTQTETAGSAAATTANTQVQAPPGVASQSGPAQGKAIGPTAPGRFPNFVGADIASALFVLRENQFNFVILEVADRSTPKGIVMRQSPAAGARADGSASVTLTISAGLAK